MARIDDILNSLDDQEQAARIRTEVNKIRRHRKFGLVFEGHEPETVTARAIVRIGHEAMLRKEPENHTKYLVESIDGGVATIESKDGDRREVPVDDLLAVLSFDDPIVPGLTHLGGLRRSDTRPAHIVISGENFHALHILLATHAGSVDVIYIDPPYNTGDKSWKYNNRFVDENDSYAHSKWLSFMERRLKLAKDLLTGNGVLIITIDEHEVHHLGVLLEQVFDGAQTKTQMATSVISAKGTSRARELSRVSEHIFFVMLGEAGVARMPTNMLDDKVPEEQGQEVEWLQLRRREPSSTRESRPNQFYPILVNERDGTLHAIGEALPADMDRNEYAPPDGTIAFWPVNTKGREMVWGLTPDALKARHSKGYFRLSNWRPDGRGKDKCPSVAFQYLQSGTITDIESGRLDVRGRDLDGSVRAFVGDVVKGALPKTVWNMESHNAETSGTNIVSTLLPGRRFDYPKSLYAIEDALSLFVADKPDAVVLDFFVGSGTTVHAVARLNRRDGGRRQCIAVTNNEVAAREQAGLFAKGVFPGEADWEAMGIFEHLTRPRIEAALTGLTPEGNPVAGRYRFNEVFDMSQGLNEAVEFFRLDYLTPDVVRTGQAYAQLIPLLWMQAGSVGQWDPEPDRTSWSMPDSSNYAVLFDPDEMTGFLAALAEREDVAHVWVDTPSQAILRQIRAEVAPNVRVARLYDDYLRDVERKPRRALQ